VTDVNLTQRLHSTTDGMVWATEFCKLFDVTHRETGEPVDEGTMVGWFANAIEIGRYAGQRGVRDEEPDEETIAQLRADLNSLWGEIEVEAFHRLNEWDPDLVERCSANHRIVVYGEEPEPIDEPFPVRREHSTMIAYMPTRREWVEVRPEDVHPPIRRRRWPLRGLL
jgi:hypothetical protein